RGVVGARAAGRPSGRRSARGPIRALPSHRRDRRADDRSGAAEAQVVEEGAGAVTERDEGLSLLDDLARLLEGSRATSIQAEADDFSLRVTRGASSSSSAEPAARERDGAAEENKLQRVHATTVGIFSSAKEWRKGDDVTRGTVLGAIQSLGHMADITAP